MADRRETTAPEAQAPQYRYPHRVRYRLSLNQQQVLFEHVSEALDSRIILAMVLSLMASGVFSTILSIEPSPATKYTVSEPCVFTHRLTLRLARGLVNTLGATR